MILDPWGAELPKDYQKLITEFGLAHFTGKELPDPNRLMRRGIVVASQDLVPIADAIKNKKPYYSLTGIMPTADTIHFGTKSVIENLAYFQEHGAETYILIADLEALTTRGISLEEAKTRAMKFYIPAYIALGLDPKKTKFYFQSQNMSVQHIAFDAARRITLNEFKAVYGIADPSRILAASTQIGDMLYPQLKKKMPGIIPVGYDQAPHLRLARDYIRRDKKYNLLSSLYLKFVPSLDGDMKMSKSKPESMLSIPEDPEKALKKLRKAVTGGRETLEEQRKKGAIIEKDMVFELMKQHLVEDDRELQQIYDDYSSGKMLSKELKDIAGEKLIAFYQDFQKKFEKAQKHVDDIELLTS